MPSNFYNLQFNCRELRNTGHCTVTLHSFFCVHARQKLSLLPPPLSQYLPPSRKHHPPLPAAPKATALSSACLPCPLLDPYPQGVQPTLLPTNNTWPTFLPPPPPTPLTGETPPHPSLETAHHQPCKQWWPLHSITKAQWWHQCLSLPSLPQPSSQWTWTKTSCYGGPIYSYMSS